jgi:hypothetical protein
MNTKELPYSFKLLFPNQKSRSGSVLREGEMVVMRVKMRADVDQI